MANRPAAISIESPSAMLFRIAGNGAADYGRAAALRRRVRSFDAGAHDTEIASEHPSPERELAARCAPHRRVRSAALPQRRARGTSLHRPTNSFHALAARAAAARRV